MPMDDRKENQLGMFRTVNQILTTESAKIGDKVKAVDVQRQNVADSIALIDIFAQAQMADRKGITLDKAELKRQMAKYAARVAAGTSAFASVQNNLVLKQKMNVSTTTVADARDNVAADVAMAVYDEATKVVAQLADYGVTQATLDALKTRIDAYKLVMNAPQVAGADREKWTGLLEAEFKRVNMIIKDRIDKMMTALEESDPDVFASYKAARKVIDSGHRKKPEAPQPS